MEDAEIRGLVERIVQERIAPLRALLSAYASEWSSENASSGGIASSTPATLAEVDDGFADLLPFEIGYDLDSESMSIYAPPGCILVDGVPAEIVGASEEGYVDLADLSDDDDNSSEDSTVYAHVTRTAGEAWSVTFDCEEYGGSDSPPDRFDFAVARYLGWPRKERLCASVVSLSTGAGGEGGTPPDNLSLDGSGAGSTLEIKSWADSNRPKTATKLAADLQGDVEASWDMVVRESDGTLKYKAPGILTGLATEATVKSIAGEAVQNLDHLVVVTGVSYDPSTGLLTTSRRELYLEVDQVTGVTRLKSRAIVGTEIETIPLTSTGSAS